jgi:hypothetical protein
MLLILLILFTVVFKTSAKALSHKENPLNDTCMSMSYWIDQDKDRYQYEVIGGLHSVTARKQLTVENDTFSTVNASIYVGLTDDEALHFAKRHNVNSSLTHKVTHKDYIQTCRTRLYRVCPSPSEGTTPQPTTQWRDECCEYILPKDMASTNKRSILDIAAVPHTTWVLLEQVMNMYERGRTKGQRISTSKLKKGATPDVKVHNLAGINKLSNDIQQQLLQEVIDGTRTLLEVKSAIDECRGLEKARRAFMKITKSVSWEEAKLKYPRHTNDMALKEFSKITSLDKNIPPAFVAFCQSAVDGQKKPDATEIQLMAVNYWYVRYVGVV